MELSLGLSGVIGGGPGNLIVHSIGTYLRTTPKPRPRPGLLRVSIGHRWSYSRSGDIYAHA
jgi:hypothetical protein